jgi:hypothetical protein
MGKEEGLGQLIGIAVYTAPDGEAQRKHLKKYRKANLVISPVSHGELLESVNKAMPASVLYDGHKIAGSVMLGILKDALGIPIRDPRILDSEHVFGGEEAEPPPRTEEPKIIGPPSSGFKVGELGKAVGKTISAVEFGKVEGLPAHVHEGEAIVLHFTDGTAMSIEIGSNVKELFYGPGGFQPGDIRTDLMVFWRNRWPPGRGPSGTHEAGP